MRAWPLDLALVATGRWPLDAERLGLRCPVAQPGSVWMHGASLGECRLARRMADAFSARGIPAFVTTDTAAGRTVADALRPIDHPAALAAAFAEARPRAIVFVENAWYPGLARRASAAGVPVLSVGMRASPRLARRGRLLGWPDAAWAVDPEAADLARRHGIELLGVGGGLKGAAPGGTHPLGVPPPFVVGVCTHPGEEAALLAARDAVCPDLAVLLAPRDLSRVDGLLKQYPRLRRRSGMQRWTHGDVVLDTFGELPDLLLGARAALIGGTFDPGVGGHSPSEALAAGVPVVHGPCTHRNRHDFVGTTAVDTLQGLAEGLNEALDRTSSSAPRGTDRVDAVVDAVLSRALRPAPESSPRPWLSGLRVVPALGMAWRRRLPRKRAPVPVVAVGSANARGSGKTSTAIWLARVLRARGHRVGVVTRGVGRIHGQCVGDSRVHGVDARWLGDEGALLALSGFRVVAHPNRWRAAQHLLGDATVWLLEDGLQTGGIAVDLRVATTDARFPNGRGPLPAGERRILVAEPDIEVVHHGPGAVEARRTPGPWAPAPPAGPALAFAGIGRSVDFFADLDDSSSEPVVTRRFPDHHRYTPDALQALVREAAGRTLVTTDRDAVRIEPVLREAIGLHWRGIELHVEGFPMERLP
jgi:tetraacyldisaccharide 4'-kinase